MRILYLIPSMSQGGAERHVLDLMTELKKYDDVEQALAIIYPESVYDFFFEPEVRALDIPVYFLDKPIGHIGRVIMAWRYFNLLRRFKPDIVNAHLWQSMDFVRVFHRWLRGPQVVCTTHGLIVDEDRLQKERNLKTAHLVSTSVGAGWRYAEQVPDVEPIVIPHCIDPTPYLEAPNYNPFPETHQIGFVAARTAPVKNQLALLEAVHELHAAGEWPEQVEIRNHGMIELPDYHQVLVDYLDQHPGLPFKLFPAVKDVAAYYHACEFLIVPSQHENFGTVIAEAGACGTPSLVTTAANTAAMVEDGVSGWVTDDLVEGLRRVFATPREQRKQMGQAVKEYVLTHHTLKQMGEAHHQLFSELVSDTKRGSKA